MLLKKLKPVLKSLQVICELCMTNIYQPMPSDVLPGVQKLGFSYRNTAAENPHLRSLKKKKAAFLKLKYNFSRLCMTIFL